MKGDCDHDDGFYIMPTPAKLTILAVAWNTKLVSSGERPIVETRVWAGVVSATTSSIVLTSILVLSELAILAVAWNTKLVSSSERPIVARRASRRLRWMCAGGYGEGVFTCAHNQF